LAKTPRTWTGARSPSGLKRVRNSQRRNAVLQPRRSAAKTYVAKALTAAAQPSDGIDPQAALAEALSALDRAAKAGAIHPNAAARRKSRLTLKVNSAVGGAAAALGRGATKTTSKGAAQKAAKARIAASKADKAKGAQTAAGKARAALSRTARDTASASATEAAPDTAAPKKTTTKSSGAKAAAPKKTTAKASASRATASKPAASKAKKS
jgi:ribosomal protein S20